MKLAYLILAHGQYEHLKRLLTALDDPRVHFYIHIDAKSPMPTNLGEFGDKITFVEPRVKVWWCGWSPIEAEFVLMRTAVADGPYDYYAMISGADYPIRSNDFIFNRLAEGGEYASLVPLDEAPDHAYRYWGYHLVDGINRRRVRDRFPSHTLGYYLTEFTEKLLWRMGVRKRHCPLPQLFVGSQWWVLSDACVRLVIESADNKPVCDFFKTVSDMSDYPVQIIGNSPFAQNVRYGMMFLDWDADPYPAWITERHLPLMAHGLASYPTGIDTGLGCYRPGEPFFARKFNDASGPICEIIDKTLRQD